MQRVVRTDDGEHVDRVGPAWALEVNRLLRNEQLGEVIAGLIAASQHLAEERCSEVLQAHELQIGRERPVPRPE